MTNISSQICQWFSRLTGYPTSGIVIDSLAKHEFKARDGLGMTISSDGSATSGITPGIGFSEGGGPIMFAVDTSLPARFRIDYLKDGKRGAITLSAEELAKVRDDLAAQQFLSDMIVEFPSCLTNLATQ